jgi:hypothetical protein
MLELDHWRLKLARSGVIWPHDDGAFWFNANHVRSDPGLLKFKPGRQPNARSGLELCSLGRAPQ